MFQSKLGAAPQNFELVTQPLSRVSAKHAAIDHHASDHDVMYPVGSSSTKIYYVGKGEFLFEVLKTRKRTKPNPNSLSVRSVVNGIKTLSGGPFMPDLMDSIKIYGISAKAHESGDSNTYLADPPVIIIQGISGVRNLLPRKIRIGSHLIFGDENLDDYPLAQGPYRHLENRRVLVPREITDLDLQRIEGALKAVLRMFISDLIVTLIVENDHGKNFSFEDNSFDMAELRKTLASKLIPRTVNSSSTSSTQSDDGFVSLSSSTGTPPPPPNPPPPPPGDAQKKPVIPPRNPPPGDAQRKPVIPPRNPSSGAAQQKPVIPPRNSRVKKGVTPPAQPNSPDPPKDMIQETQENQDLTMQDGQSSMSPKTTSTGSMPPPIPPQRDSFLDSLAISRNSQRIRQRQGATVLENALLDFIEQADQVIDYDTSPDMDINDIIELVDHECRVPSIVIDTLFPIFKSSCADLLLARNPCVAVRDSSCGGRTEMAFNPILKQLFRF